VRRALVVETDVGRRWRGCYLDEAAITSAPATGRPMTASGTDGATHQVPLALPLSMRLDSRTTAAPVTRRAAAFAWKEKSRSRNRLRRGARADERLRSRFLSTSDGARGAPFLWRRSGRPDPAVREPKLTCGFAQWQASRWPPNRLRGRSCGRRRRLCSATILRGVAPAPHPATYELPAAVCGRSFHGNARADLVALRRAPIASFAQRRAAV
jgi:hypothetical protein